jgi:hypothetical protein
MNEYNHMQFSLLYNLISVVQRLEEYMTFTIMLGNKSHVLTGNTLPIPHVSI